MPSRTDILQTLGLVSNEQAIVAIVWHALIAIVVVGIFLGWRPSQKAGATALSIPFLSVSVIAWVYKNPFNGSVFLLLAVILFIIGLRRPSEKVDAPPVWASVAGVALIIFGWIYPHFLAAGTWLRYLYRAPTGLIPCATLTCGIGFALLANGFSSRAYSICLVVPGLFYGLTGVFSLGVTIDVVLLLGAIALLTLAFTRRLMALSRVRRGP